MALHVPCTPPVPPVVGAPQLVVQDATQLPGLLTGLVDDVRMFALENKAEMSIDATAEVEVFSNFQCCYERCCTN